jgi:hypothetical protein
MKRLILVFFFLLFAIISFSQQMAFEINGNITFNNANYYISEAGEDFQASIENQSSLYISVVYSSFWDKLFNPNKKWSVSINKTDVLWDSRLILEARRTGDGSGLWGRNVNINGGTQFHSISDTPIYFFRGKNEIYDIPIAFKVSGASVTMGAKQFETNIILTVSDDW